MFDSFFQWFEDKLAEATFNALRRGVERAKSPPALADATEEPAPAGKDKSRNGRHRIAAE